MAELPSPSEVLKTFIGLEETTYATIARSTPTISKYQHRSYIKQLVTLPESKCDPSLALQNSVITMPRSTPTISKYQHRSYINQLDTLPESKCDPSLAQQNLVITMPRNLSSSIVSRSSMCSISDNKSLQADANCSDLALKRKNAMKKPYSPWRSTIEIDDTTKVQKKNVPLWRAFSASVLQNSVFPYNPDNPLLKKLQLKKSHVSHLVRARSIKTTIGPLTKEVCEQLNILVKSDNHSLESHKSCLHLKIPDLTDDKVFLVEVNENTTLMTVKAQLIGQLKRQYPGNNRWDFIHNCQFVYTINGHDYQLLDDCQYIYNSFLYQNFLHICLFPLIEVRKNRLHTEEETLLFDKIHTITKLRTYRSRSNSQDSGVFDSTQTFNHDGDQEMVWAKLTLQSFAIEVARHRDPVNYSMLTELDYSPITQQLASKIPHNIIKIFIHAQKVLTLEKSFNVNSTATKVLAEVLPALQNINLVHHSKIENYALQVTGEENYIVGDIRLLDFKAVRRAIFKKQDLHLSVVNKPQSFKDQLCDINWPLVDPFTGTAPTHDYLIGLSNSVNTINAISLWDLTFPFKICIKKISNVPSHHYKKDTNVEIEIGMYVGGKLLTEPVKTSTATLKEETTWNETLTFDFRVDAIPKATRLVIIVREDKKGRRRSSDTIISNLELYWAAVSLIDSRNILKVGTHELYMWTASKTIGKDTEDADVFHCDPNPIGPIANNPDPNAVQLTLEFESWNQPIIFPNDVLETTAAYLPRTLTRNSYENGISVIAEALQRNEAMVMNLQGYIQRVDWSNPQQITEAYNLLSHLKEPLPLVVAFSFLDSGCADEFIRAFAVERLRELQDEELTDYLLQLVQALKFEANHDSALARFLLERALQNKSIGHFFFWYCRCEAQNPQFTVRYNTLLEAYLVGCGKAMLNDFLDQVSTLDYFEKISKELAEAKCQNASESQRVLKQLFNKHKFCNNSIIPAYCPRLRLGNLDPERCKVMQSKKMPMWLWMSNVHPSAIEPQPYKLILKNGDDLRQDMLTLQMLSLFDKIWQKDGLDLCLIPYGCVATGPNSGVIEVVKDAKTVANISGIRNSNKLLQWIKDHQKDQFGEEDPDLVQSAINRFVRSCAGYSVATYVLGIGDRHNDNIMVTTSGNLFHIDFGHFLGNVKHFMNIKREWCPFVLTPDFIHVMGGEKSVTFTNFKSLCCKAFLSLRQHADLIINLFSMMRYTGIPELTCVEDIDYLRNALMVTKDGLTAEMEFDKLLNKCIKLGWTVQISWWAHVIKTA